jgi:hypothetical protein
MQLKADSGRLYSVPECQPPPRRSQHSCPRLKMRSEWPDYLGPIRLLIKLQGIWEPILPKRISPLSSAAQPSAFSSSAKCASWRPGSFGDGVLIFRYQLPFSVHCRKSQLLSVKRWRARYDLSLARVLRRFFLCPRRHLLSRLFVIIYRNGRSPQITLCNPHTTDT